MSTKVMEENNVLEHHELNGVEPQIVDVSSHEKGAHLSQLSGKYAVVVEEKDAAMDLKLQAIDSHPQKRGIEPIEHKDAATGSRLQENDSRSQDRGKEPIGNGNMRHRYMDAMALVQRFGHPDIFLTMACNPDWVEIRKELHRGQHAEDRPDLIALVFHAKLQDLKKLLFTKNFFGEVAARVHVIEFQERGLPHAHFLIILKRRYKLTNPDQYDRFVCAEISDPQNYPELYKLVVGHMLHGSCGPLGNNCPCMRNGKCIFSYPKQFSEKTVQRKNSYLVYRRRNNGQRATKKAVESDNRWVAPYNPYLLMRYNCHINVEICTSIQAVNNMWWDMNVLSAKLESAI